MVMKYRAMGLTVLTAMPLVNLSACQKAQAQAQIYTYVNTPASRGQHQYALLNGDLLALYLNDRGDLGAPYRGSQGNLGNPEKPVGLLDAAQKPYIRSDGSVDTTTVVNGQQNGTYGVLYSDNSVPTSGLSIADSVRAKSEYLTVGGNSVAEGFAVSIPAINSAGEYTPMEGFTVQPNGFTVSGATASSPLTATSTLFRRTGTAAQGLQITQTVSFQQSGTPENRVQFNVKFTNTDSKALNGLRYVRAFDPNQGGPPPASLPNNPNGNGRTVETFGVPSDPNAFAIDSLPTTNTAGIDPRHFGVGVVPGQAHTIGSIVQAANTTNNSMLLSLAGSQLADPTQKYVELGAQNPNGTFSASVFNPVGDLTTTAGDILTSSVTDYKSLFSDPQNPFRFLGSNPKDAGLLLYSPLIDVAPGATEEFNFYYFFDNKTDIPSSVPEPGTFALLAGGLTFGGFMRRRVRK